MYESLEQVLDAVLGPAARDSEFSAPAGGFDHVKVFRLRRGTRQDAPPGLIKLVPDGRCC
jgi:hypothetical protein